jgi:hypothetical protein
MVSRQRPNNRHNRFLRLAAALALAAFGALALGVFVPLGIGVMAAGLAAAGYQGAQMWRERPGPYDLSRIWEEGPDPEVPEGANWDLEVAMCRNCGLGVPNHIKICPECVHVIGM